MENKWDDKRFQKDRERMNGKQESIKMYEK